MLPPDWKLTREEISSMSYEDLREFDVSVFMQSYRQKMTKVGRRLDISSFDRSVCLDCRAA